MVLTAKALQQINKPAIRLRLAIVLSCTEQTIMRYIANNSDDLTKASAMMVIREETGLTDLEILEEIKLNETVK